MLILQRRAGESLLIGEDITVSVVSIDGVRVRLAIMCRSCAASWPSPAPLTGILQWKSPLPTSF